MAESGIYLERGVSSEKKDVHEAIKKVDRGAFPGAFCKVLPDLITGETAYYVLMHADGAGTKSSLAYLYWKETGDLSVFKGIAIDSLVMNIDDLACVGAVDKFLLSNTIGRNKFRIPGEIVRSIIDGFEEAIVALEKYDIQIDFCGGETADVGDLVRTLIVDSTMMTRLNKNKIIDLNNIAAGDKIIGIASFGQATGETTYNSGIGSNGLTAARHDCLSREYAEKYPESYSAEIPDNLVYCGKGKLNDHLDGTPLTLGQALLSPSRTYTPLIKKILQQHHNQINGIIHCTGGGQTKCLNFGQGIHYFKDNLFPIPPIFRFIQKTRDYTLKEMAAVFNLGHRLEIFVKDNIVEDIITIAKEYGIEARVIGYCQKSAGSKNQLTIKHKGEISQF